MKKVLIFSFFWLLVIPVKAITVTSESAILLDQDSGRVLYAKQENKQLLIASITKIMTAVLAIESNRLDEIVTVDASILKAYGSNIYLEVGEELTLRDLVYGLMLRSGNDAAIMIANFVGGEEANFVKRMNEKAQQLGMKNSVFVNPHGLDEKGGNLATAYDMALLTKYANNLTEYKTITKTKIKRATSNYKSYIWQNKNKLLDLYKWTTGGKTGFTEQAGRTLVSTASRGGLNLIVVTLNDGADWNTHQELYNYGFNNYKQYLVLNAHTFTVNSKYHGERLYIKHNYYYPLKEKETANIYLKAKILKQKVKKTDPKCGVVEVYYKNDLVHSEDLYIESKQPIKKERSFWQRFWGWWH